MLLAFALAAPLLPAPHTAPPAKEPKLRWLGDNYALDELPEGMREAARGAARAWAGFAEDLDYDLTLSDDQRILLVTPAGKSTA
ncbi:MAG TPA: hypothetical protein VJP77_03095, partial [Planctomycetota bacterium]|nr:hypothetical protein [Planctomycetota bacterium]